MSRRAKIWRVVAALFALINLGGAGVAAAASEGPHTAIHVVLALLGVYVAWRLTPRPGRDTLPGASSTEPQLSTDARLDQLQQSMDAVAVEVERIGEAQRYNAKVQAGRPEPPR